MPSLPDLITEACRRPDTKPFLFRVGQRVMVKPSVLDDGQTPAHWAAAIGVVVKRSSSPVMKDHWYSIRHCLLGVTCDFREEELYRRFARRR
jgi:hypothetical protein